MINDGVVPCACRDCPDAAVGKAGVALCLACEKSGCIPAEWDDSYGDIRAGYEYDCRAPDAYESVYRDTER